VAYRVSRIAYLQEIAWLIYLSKLDDGPEKV